MRTLAAGRFRQTCLSVLDEVRETGETVLITKGGIPVARQLPVEPATSWLGSMRGTAEITGDIVAPIADTDEWSVRNRSQE